MNVIGLVSRSRLFLDCAAGFLKEMKIGEVRTWPSIEEALWEWRAHSTAPNALIVDWPDAAAAIELPVRRVKRDRPGCALILLANEPDLDQLAVVFGAGADGVLSTDAGCAPLAHALGLVLAGEKVFPSKLAGMIGALADRERALGELPADLPVLDTRERAVAARIADGMPNKSIASELGVSEAVIKSVVKATLRKLRLRNRTQLAVWVHHAWKSTAGPIPSGSLAAS